MLTRDQLLTLLKAEKARLLSAHQIRSLALFGSYARGEAALTSDVDLLVELEKGMSLFDLNRVANELEEALGLRVDLVPRGSVRKELKTQILAEAVEI